MYKDSDLRGDVLDKVWRDWNARTSNKHVYETSYANVVRSTMRASAFEDWLYDHGAYIIQKNRKRFIRFHCDQKAVMFLLQWG